MDNGMYKLYSTNVSRLLGVGCGLRKKMRAMVTRTGRQTKVASQCSNEIKEKRKAKLTVRTNRLIDGDVHAYGGDHYSVTLVNDEPSDEMAI